MPILATPTPVVVTPDTDALQAQVVALTQQLADVRAHLRALADFTRTTPTEGVNP